MTQELLVEKEGHICTITFNRPERRNALSPALLFELYKTMNSLKDDEEIRCVVLRGAGEKAFSSGYDITSLPTDLTPEIKEALKRGNPVAVGLTSVLEYPYPVIAMINGYAYGAGCNLALICDIRITVDTAKFGMPPVKLGIIYHPTGIQQFIDVVGVANAREMFFTGRSITAERAKEIGLVNYVVPADQLISATYELARSISENAPLALKGTKTIIRKLLSYRKLTPEDEAEIGAFTLEAFRSEDLKEGQRAFLEKRKPQFKGR